MAARVNVSLVAAAVSLVLAGAAAAAARRLSGGGRTFAARTAAASRAARLPLAGKVVGIDPGHNGRNYTDPAFIDHWIWNGREEELCDTTGTETDGGYTEAQFNWNVAGYLARDLGRRARPWC